VVRVTGDPAVLSGLAAEFPGYEFGTQRTWGGISITAVRHDGAARPGLYVIVTDDLNEMRRALLEHEHERPNRLHRDADEALIPRAGRRR
jgi:hypothetical protein